jgi:hypothetical protein
MAFKEFFKLNWVKMILTFVMLFFSINVLQVNKILNLPINNNVIGNISSDSSFGNIYVFYLVLIIGFYLISCVIMHIYMRIISSS